MLKPYFRTVDAPGVGGVVTGMWFNPPWYCIIRSQEIQVSSWAGPVRNSFRELSAGGVTFGLFGQNYWISDDYWMGKIIGWFK